MGWRERKSGVVVRDMGRQAHEGRRKLKLKALVPLRKFKY
jgi:hypothetical protein